MGAVGCDRPEASRHRETSNTTSFPHNPFKMPKHTGAFKRIAIAGALKGNDAGGHATGSYIVEAILEMNKFRPGTFEDVLIVGRGELAKVRPYSHISSHLQGD